MGGKRTSAAAENRLYVVAVRIEHEGGVVARRIAFGSIAKPRRAVIGPACLHSSRMEGIDLGAVPGREGRMLLHAMWVKTVNPENRVIDTIANAIGSVVLGKLHDPMEAKRAQSRIVKGGGTGDVRDSNSGVVDRCDVLRSIRVPSQPARLSANRRSA
jgi:hypothetical protein